METARVSDYIARRRANDKAFEENFREESKV